MAKAVIRIKDLKKYFGKVKAVDGISLDVKKGEVFGFLGPNGAGKTTTIRCILDFIHPTGGSIKILGQDHHVSSVMLKKHLGYLSGESELYGNMKVREYLNYILSLHGEKVDKLSVKYITYVHQFNLQDSLKRKIKTLSRGNKQKVSLIAALMTEPDILIMDEPTSGLDPLMQEEFYKILNDMRKKGKTIFMSSHILSEVEKICDRAAIIKEGKIIAIEDIQDLHKKGLLNILVETKEKIQKEIFERIDSVSEILTAGKETKIVVKGSPDKVIKELAKYSVKRIEIKHADLEEIFIEFYS
jgi:ABC-2 type transport system ATP-binding protein